MSEPLKFYGGMFSNFAASHISLDLGWGMKTYATVEHAFQAAKATNEIDHDTVRRAPRASLAKKAGRQIRLRPDWEEMKYDVMLECLRAKFALPQFKRALLATGDRELREDSPSDYIWGYRNNGLNLLGKALMQVREEIREKDPLHPV